MSEHPRTDLQIQVGASQGHPGYVHASFARVLEMEIADHRAKSEARLRDVQAELGEARDLIREIQQKCVHLWEKVDDSFDHAFGCEVIRYMRCEQCGKQKEWDDEGPDSDDGVRERDDDEPNYDAPKPLTALENHQRNDEHNVR